MPRVRFTVRGMMIAVAVVAVALGMLVERRQRFGRIASNHRNQAGRWFASLERSGGSGDLSYEGAIFGWHMKKHLKYEHAARYPWLPVAPDAPEPE